MTRFPPLLAALLIAFSTLSAGSAQAAGRNTALIDAFEAFCTLKPPSFAGLDQKAQAMRLVVHKNLAQNYQHGMYARSKSWFVPLTTGRIELLDAESNGPRAHAVSCGISATDPNGEALRKDLVTALKLGRPTARTLAPNGALQMTIWQNTLGNGSSLVFVEPAHPGIPGALLSYTIKTPPQQ